MPPDFYVNLFRDNAGGIHYSTEEFVLGQQGLLHLEEAVLDAHRFSVLGDWHYICTLTPDEHITLKIQRWLHILEQARFILEEQGRDNSGYDMIAGLGNAE